MIGKTFELPEGLQGATFFSKKAGSFSDVPQRTVQAWTEAGLIVSKTKGTGNRRRYSVLECIEIGIVKSLSKEGIRTPIILKIMRFLRKYKPNNLEHLLAEEEGYLVVRLDAGGRITPHIYGHSKEKKENKSLIQYWRLISMPTDCDKVLIVNVSRVGKKVLARMK